MASSSLSCSISDSGGYSPNPSQPSSSPAPSWSSSSPDHIPLEQWRATERSSVGIRSATGRAPIQHRPAIAGPSSTMRESPEWTAPTMTAQDIVNNRAEYCLPTDMRLFRPVPEDRVTSTRPGRVALYRAFFKAGLQLPLHPFILNLLDRYSLPPAQLVPNFIRTIVGFLVLCHFHGIEARISLFRSFYTLRKQAGWWSFAPRPTRALKLYLPTSVKGWKDRFFFADVEGVRGVWGTPNTDPNKDSSILPRDQVAFGQLLTADIPRCNQLLAEENLQLAGLIPSGGEQP